MSGSQSLFHFVASSVTASCRSYSHVPLSQHCFLICTCFVSVLLSQVPCSVSVSLTPFLLCLSCLVTVLALSCALLCLGITPLICYALPCLSMLSHHHAALLVLCLFQADSIMTAIISYHVDRLHIAQRITLMHASQWHMVTFSNATPINWITTWFNHGNCCRSNMQGRLIKHCYHGKDS